MADGFLHASFLANPGKRIRKWIHYFDIYERHLARFRGTSPVMVEIGVKTGGSLGMWRAYLGPGSRVVGIDIDPSCKAHEAEGIDVVVGSQDDPAVIDSVLAAHPRIDIVLDDGSHLMRHMTGTFRLLYERLHPDGVYIVEDTHACYWEKYDGGLRREGSFIEFAKDRIDDLHAVHARGALPVSEFTRSTDHICFYDSMVVFERRRQGQRQALNTGGM